MPALGGERRCACIGCLTRGGVDNAPTFGPVSSDHWKGVPQPSCCQKTAQTDKKKSPQPPESPLRAKEQFIALALQNQRARPWNMFGPRRPPAPNVCVASGAVPQAHTAEVAGSRRPTCRAGYTASSSGCVPLESGNGRGPTIFANSSRVMT